MAAPLCAGRAGRSFVARTRVIGSLDDALIAGFYEAASGLRTWPEVLDRFTEATRAFVCQFLVTDKTRGQLALCESSSSAPVAGVLDYIREYHAIDPHMAHAMTRPVGEILHTAERFPRAEYESHRFYRDFWAPYNIRSMVAAKVAEDERFVAFACAMRTFDQSEFTPDDLALVSRGLGHVRTALGVARHLERLQDSASVGERLMESSDRPMVLIERSRSVLATNAAARRYLDGDAPLALRDGCLVGRSSPADAAIERALEQLAELKLREPGDPAPRVAARVPARSGDFAWCTLWDLAPESSMGAFGRRRAILLSVAPRSRAVSLDPMVVSAMFELTPAETRIAIALAQGDDLAAIAMGLRLSLATVRSQLKSVFAKAGVHRQTDLVQLLIRMNAT